MRIIAMFMILMHHFIVHNGYDVLKLPLGPERIFFQLVMAGGGKVGVVIFFSISAWFFLDREQTIKSNLRRVWIMERELLFWSLILLASYLAFDRADLGMKLMVKSFVPLSMNVWWYATAYAIFLALLPFLSKGLKALGREYHLALATTVLVIWGLTSFIPGMVGISDGFFGFIYLFILISAYKRHLQLLSNKQTWILTLAGVGFVLLYTAASTVLGLFGINKGIFITGDWKLPVVTIGFGMFLLFDRVTFHSCVINRIAQSAFAVYLITDYTASEKLLWVRLFNLKNLCQ
ncbi:acyltransferase family protein [Bifidobacterium adolescentis]|uniref:acyltransferase family protein n=1 Tax=Bifidobacterium adolescentis TaxID=1680 RepID=UPI003B99D273